MQSQPTQTLIGTSTTTLHLCCASFSGEPEGLQRILHPVQSQLKDCKRSACLHGCCSHSCIVSAATRPACTSAQRSNLDRPGKRSPSLARRTSANIGEVATSVVNLTLVVRLCLSPFSAAATACFESSSSDLVCHVGEARKPVITAD